MFGSRSAAFDRFLERATSQLLLEPDWDSILQICDCVRQEDVQPKYAVQAVKKKVNNDNPHVATFALLALESMVKNCGSLVHEQIATKEFMEYYKETLQKKPEPIKSKMLELLQVWSHAFRDEVGYKIVQDTYNLLKMEGHKFPVLKESDAMFSAERAPEWKDGDVCSRCRTSFTTFNRKHHCRHCAEVFCSKCSSKNSIIPKFGIEREVRVCDACYESINNTGDKEGSDLPQEYLSSPLAKQTQGPPSKSEQEIQEEEELQLALALSQSEAEAHKQKKGSANYSLYGSSNKALETVSKPPEPVQVTAPTFDTSEMDPELARYLNRNYWQNKSEVTKSTEVAPTTQPSAPTAMVENKAPAAPKEEEHYQNGETETTPADQKQFLEALKGSIEIFVNRMKSNQSRGRSIANDSSVQTLFMTISQMHPQLLHYIQEQEDVRMRCENLQDKLAQLKDAREALDVLRDEHREKRRREQEELERSRAIQMAQKLEVLRQKKQEYLEYQRQLALQRMEDQKREMDMRLAHQKQMQMQRAMQYGMVSLPQMYGNSQPEASAMHHPQMMQTPYGAPMTQMPMGAPPGAPGGGAPGGGAPPSQMQLPPGGMGGQMSMASLPPGLPGANMYGQQPPIQQQATPSGQQQAPPTSQSIMAGYQGAPAPGGITSAGGYAPQAPTGYHPGQPQPPYQQMVGGQQQQQPQQPVYTSGPPTSDYSFNMQNVAASLPAGHYMGGGSGGGPVGGDQYQAHGGPPTQAPPPSQIPPPQAGLPPHQMQASLQQPQAPPQQQAPPPSQGQQDVAQLISFD